MDILVDARVGESKPIKIFKTNIEIATSLYCCEQWKRFIFYAFSFRELLHVTVTLRRKRKIKEKGRECRETNKAVESNLTPPESNMYETSQVETQINTKPLRNALFRIGMRLAFHSIRAKKKKNPEKNVLGANLVLQVIAEWNPHDWRIRRDYMRMACAHEYVCASDTNT